LLEPYRHLCRNSNLNLTPIQASSGTPGEAARPEQCGGDFGLGLLSGLALSERPRWAARVE
jgi:hypothetical protein